MEIQGELEMSEDQKKQLQTQLWNITNKLRGKMGADEFRDYILESWMQLSGSTQRGLA